MDKPLVRQRAFFFGMVLILAVLALLLVWQFTQAILFALAMVVILKPVYTWLFNKKGINGKASRATALTMVIFILIIAIPLGLILFGAFSQADRFFTGLNIEGIDFSVRGIITAIEKTLQGIGAGNLRFDEIQILRGGCSSSCRDQCMGQRCAAQPGPLAAQDIHQCHGYPGFDVRAASTL